MSIVEVVSEFGGIRVCELPREETVVTELNLYYCCRPVIFRKATHSSPREPVKANFIT
jgi:hypothetical protein